MTPNMVSIQPSFLLIASASDSPRRCGFTRNYSHAISLLIMVLSVPGSNPGGGAPCLIPGCFDLSDDCDYRIRYQL
jgi:hypothetical protein